MRYRFPDGKRFAFTIIDDTDVATVENVRPVYRLLEELGMRTTKTVWPLRCPEGSPNYETSQTLEDPEYRAFVLDLQRRGFEIASHGATMESSDRERTARGLEVMRATFGAYPRVYANHANNLENLYWGEDRVDHPVLRALYRRTLSGHRTYQGHVKDSPWWWGDLASRHIGYVRNLTYETLDVSRVNPTMPYHDPTRPLVNGWFSAADADNRDEFVRIMRPAQQVALERNGGIAILATHLGKGFVTGTRVHPEAERLLRMMAARPGWFVPVGELLDWLREAGHGASLPRREWARMQWRWMRDLLVRGARDRLLRALSRHHTSVTSTAEEAPA